MKHSLILSKVKDKSWASNSFSSGPEKRAGVLLKFKKTKIKFGPDGELTKGKFHSFKITWPSGKIDIFILQSHLYEFVNYYYLYFSLDSKFRLNVTFISLVLQDLGAHCYFDKLEIEDHEQTKLSYRYCGKYSRFIVYPLFIKLVINIILESQNDFKLKASFCVIDKSLILSPIDALFPVFPAEEDMEVNFELKPQYYKVGNTYYLQSFFLRVTKLHNIKLLYEKSEKNNIAIYDGPGFMFKILKFIEQKLTLHNFNISMCLTVHI